MKCLRNILFAGLGLVIAPPALADCDLSTYDRSFPKTINSEVDNGIVRFEWSTDVDTVDGRNWIWHYVRNLHPDRGLGYKWPKADLRRSLGSPLQPGKTDCNRYFVTTAVAPDDNAPITFGTNDSVQRAAVYSEPKITVGDASGSSTAPILSNVASASGSLIETSYKTGAGSENVRIALSANQDRGKWNFVIERTPNVIMAIARDFLNGEQQAQAVEQLRRQEAGVDIGPLAKTLGRDDKEILSAFFLENELAARRNQSYLIITNVRASKFSISLPASGSRPISTDLILFDREGQPFFATSLKLIAPNSAN
jgi:hypothetical protein